MNSRRDYRGNRVALFDGIEEGGLRASSSYTSHEISEHDNDIAIDGLEDRVTILKRLTGDIHEEVESHNRALDRMGNDMDSSRGILSGTMDRFKSVRHRLYHLDIADAIFISVIKYTVFETKSKRQIAIMVASFVALFFVIYYLTK